MTSVFLWNIKYILLAAMYAVGEKTSLKYVSCGDQNLQAYDFNKKE